MHTTSAHEYKLMQNMPQIALREEIKDALGHSRTLLDKAQLLAEEQDTDSFKSSMLIRLDRE